MSKDTIYRQDAMNVFDCSIGGVPVESVKYVSEYADKMMSRINALPSAKPERKQGKWTLLPNGNALCSECGYMQVHAWDLEGWDNYCHHCGADMR